MTESREGPAGETPPASSSSPPTNRMLIALLALIGLFVALYLWAHNAGLTGPIVCGVGDCATVQASEWATLGPIPVSSIGVVGYLVLIALAVIGVQPAHRSSPLIGGLLLAGSAGGVAFSAWLTYLEAFVINAWCQYCVISAILITLIFFAALPEVGRIRRGAS